MGDPSKKEIKDYLEKLEKEGIALASGKTGDPIGSFDWIEKVKNSIKAQSDAGVPEPLSPFDQAVGFLSIIFKVLVGGKFGWIRTGNEVEVTAHIGRKPGRRQGTDRTAPQPSQPGPTGSDNGAWKSTDGFITLDVELQHLKSQGQLLLKCNETGEFENGLLDALIRVEIRPKVGKKLSKEKKRQLKTCTWVRIGGLLRWDRDGHWEIIPDNPEQIHILTQDEVDRLPPILKPSEPVETPVQVPEPPSKPVQRNVPNPGDRESRRGQTTLPPSDQLSEQRPENSNLPRPQNPPLGPSPEGRPPTTQGPGQVPPG